MDRRGFFRRIAGCVAGAVASPLALSQVEKPKFIARIDGSAVCNPLAFRPVEFKVTELTGYTHIHPSLLDTGYFTEQLSLENLQRYFPSVQPDAIEIIES